MTTPYPVPPAVEEPLGAVTRVLALTEDAGGGNGADSFTGRSLPQLSGRIYGGQVVAQGLLAAAATMIDDGDGARLPHSVHAYFMRAGEPDEPLRFDVERLHDGRSFSQRRTTASQNGVPVLAMISSFQELQAGADVQLDPPEAPDPDELVSSLEIFRTLDHPVAKFLGRTAAFDLRHVEGSVYLRPDGRGIGRQRLWARARGRVPAEADQTVHRALLAYMCDQVMLEPALRSQGLSWRSQGMSLATLDHAQWFHRDVDVSDWLLFVQDSPSSTGGRAMARAEVFDTSGRLVSTIAQEGMVRTPTSTSTSTSTPTSGGASAAPGASAGDGEGRWRVRVAQGDSAG